MRALALFPIIGYFVFMYSIVASLLADGSYEDYDRHRKAFD